MARRSIQEYRVLIKVPFKWSGSKKDHYWNGFNVNVSSTWGEGSIGWIVSELRKLGHEVKVKVKRISFSDLDE